MPTDATQCHVFNSRIMLHTKTLTQVLKDSVRTHIRLMEGPEAMLLVDIVAAGTVTDEVNDLVARCAEWEIGVQELPWLSMNRSMKGIVDELKIAYGTMVVKGAMMSDVILAAAVMESQGACKQWAKQQLNMAKYNVETDNVTPYGLKVTERSASARMSAKAIDATTKRTEKLQQGKRSGQSLDAKPNGDTENMSVKNKDASKMKQALDRFHNFFLSFGRECPRWEKFQSEVNEKDLLLQYSMYQGKMHRGRLCMAN